MVILHIANSYGGTAVYTNLYTAIDTNMDVEQWIYVPLNSRNHKRVGNMMIDFKNHKSKIVYSTILKPWHRYLYGTKIWTIVRDVEHRFDLRRVDVIHAGSLCLDGAVAYELSKRYNIPYITAVRGTDKIYYRLRWRHSYFSHILKRASQVIFISPKFRELFLNAYIREQDKTEIENHTRVIPNGVGQVFLSNMNIQKRKPDDKTLHLIFIAAFYKGKGLIETILAIDELRKKGYNITLNAIGKGLPNRPFDEDYMKQVESVSCNKKWVRLQPFLPPTALIDEMRQADAFIMVSSPETFGLVYVEALSQCLPVIYAKDEGFDGFYPDGFVGYSAKAGNISSIAKGIEILINNYGTLANNILSLNLKDRFDWNAIALHYINLYNSCIKKMKIGLLTFHTSANYGAVLQAFALQHFLEQRGYDAEYLDYQNHCRRMFYDIPYHVKTLLREGKVAEALFYFVGMPFLNWRKKKFESFRKQYLRISSNTWHTPEELAVTNNIYDTFVIGSDQVWNHKHNGSDTSFMLSFVNNPAKTISYASSFGMSEVPESLKAAYANSLYRICHLSTREQNGVDIIKSLTGRDAQLVLDPVFLPERDVWLKLIGEQPKSGNYLFSYTNEKRQMRDFLKVTGYNMNGMRHHKLSRFTTITDFLSSSVKVKYGMSPIDFLSNINGADLVVSASFHCISFAIILNRPFICILSGNEGRNERLITLLSHFGLTDRIFSKKMTLNDVQKPINWNKVNGLIEKKRKESVSFLLNALNPKS